jgi:hypothetical protein
MIAIGMFLLGMLTLFMAFLALQVSEWLALLMAGAAIMMMVVLLGGGGYGRH